MLTAVLAPEVTFNSSNWCLEIGLIKDQKAGRNVFQTENYVYICLPLCADMTEPTVLVAVLDLHLTWLKSVIFYAA